MSRRIARIVLPDEIGVSMGLAGGCGSIERTYVVNAGPIRFGPKEEAPDA